MFRTEQTLKVPPSVFLSVLQTRALPSVLQRWALQSVQASADASAVPTGQLSEHSSLQASAPQSHNDHPRSPARTCSSQL